MSQHALIKHSVEVITPEIAAKYLKLNTENRPVASGALTNIMRALKNNEWKVNGESIKFDKQGKMIDGQHRCLAVIKTGIPLVSVVLRDLDKDVFDTIDQGRKRQASDVLWIRGEKKNITQLASAARWYIFMTTSTPKADITIKMIEDAVKEHSHIRWWVNATCELKTKKFMPALFASVLALAAEKHGQALIEQFLHQVADGINLGKYAPALMLRERFIDRKRGVQFGPETQLAYCIKAINAFTQEKELKFLRWSMDEGMPEIL